MRKFGKLWNLFISKTIIAVILGFLLGLFSEILIFFVPDPIKMDVVIILLFPILLLIVYLSGFFAEIISRYYKWRRFQTPIRIGVLNGFLDESKKGIECRAIYVKKKDWSTEFQKMTIGRKKIFSVDEIFWSEISLRFAAIINPFGEVYLEKDKRIFSTNQSFLDSDS